MKIDDEEYQAIAAEISSDSSPVGIDAKKTHVIVIQMLREIQERLDRLEAKIDKQI